MTKVINLFPKCGKGSVNPKNAKYSKLFDSFLTMPVLNA
jgi:hypothetical protein